MTTKELLQAARMRIERGWTQTVEAVDAKGIPVACTSERAAAWCISGALVAESIANGIEQLDNAFWSLRMATGESNISIIEWNDRAWRTQSEVLALFDRAIARWSPEG